MIGWGYLKNSLKTSPLYVLAGMAICLLLVAGLFYLISINDIINFKLWCNHYRDGRGATLQPPTIEEYYEIKEELRVSKQDSAKSEEARVVLLHGLKECKKNKEKLKNRLEHLVDEKESTQSKLRDCEQLVRGKKEKQVSCQKYLIAIKNQNEEIKKLKVLNAKLNATKNALVKKYSLKNQELVPPTFIYTSKTSIFLGGVLSLTLIDTWHPVTYRIVGVEIRDDKALRARIKINIMSGNKSQSAVKDLETGDVVDFKINGVAYVINILELFNGKVQFNLFRII